MTTTLEDLTAEEVETHEVPVFTEEDLEFDPEHQDLGGEG